jgi:hypothetical protein
MEYKLPHVLIMNIASNEMRRKPGSLQYSSDPIANIAGNPGYQNIQSTLSSTSAK